MKTTAFLVNATGVGPFDRSRAAGEADGQLAGVAATVDDNGRDRVGGGVGEGLGQPEAAHLDGRRVVHAVVGEGRNLANHPGLVLALGVPGAVASRATPAELAGEDVEDLPVRPAEPRWRRRAVRFEVEVEQLDVDQREVEVHGERAEPDHDEHLDVERELSSDVEQADRVVRDRAGELEQAELAVVVRVVPVEADSELDAAEDTDLEDADGDGGARLEVAGELHHRDRDAVLVDRLEVEAVQHLRAVTCLDRAADAVGVESRRDPECHRGTATDDHHDRRWGVDRPEGLLELEAQAQRTAVELDQRDVAAGDEPEEDRRVLDHRDRDTGGQSRLRLHLGGELAGGVLGIDLLRGLGVRLRRADERRGAACVGARRRCARSEQAEAADSHAAVVPVALHAGEQLLDGLDGVEEGLDLGPSWEGVELVRQRRDGDRVSAGCLGQVRDHRHRREDRVDDRLQRLGRVHDLLQVGLQRLAEEVTRVQGHVVELDDQSCGVVGLGAAWRRGRSGALAPGPGQSEVGGDAGQRRVRLGVEVPVDVDLGVDADLDGVGHLDPRELRQGEGVVRVEDVDAEVADELGLGGHPLLHVDIDDRQLRREVGSGDRVELQCGADLELVLVLGVDVEARAAAHADLDVEGPADLAADRAAVAGLEREPGEAEVDRQLAAGSSRRGSRCPRSRECRRRRPGRAPARGSRPRSRSPRCRPRRARPGRSTPWSSRGSVPVTVLSAYVTVVPAAIVPTRV